MAFDDIPEDIREQYPCPECNGDVERNNDGEWICLDCGKIMGEKPLDNKP